MDLEKAPTVVDAPPLHHIESHLSHHELHGAVSTHTEANAAQYERFSEHRKIIITAVLSLCGFLAPISSTSILSAVPEVADEYHTTGSVINLSNALYLIAMGLSPCVWGPLSQIYGRRWVCKN
jgi:Major Facilitator Superfamily